MKSSSARQSAARARTADGPDGALDDPRVFEAMQEYLLALESGRRPAPEEFLDRHPYIRATLAGCIDALELVHAVGQRPAPPLVSSPAGDAHPAVPLGDFQLLREIGRGGMGVVYEAIQLSLGRRVALKVLPFAAALDAKHLQRFKNEAQAAAFLHHPNIVPVYGVGYERGTHFYAMQLIEGVTVADVIRQLRRDLGRADPEGESTSGPAASAAERVLIRGAATFVYDRPPQANLPAAPPPEKFDAPTVLELSTARSKDARKYYRTVARLAADAAAALEHAHQVGIIHRDVKPGNLMLDGRGHLWITDFGLAQFHMDGGLTATGDLVGTLRYMSPEQALGRPLQLDHRADVYSLGVTLYELLTLEPAFPGSDRQELLRRLASEEPRSPRAVDPGIPVELETIVLKAMRKSRGDRYATAQALADDLHRFLDEKPIMARRPSLVERTRKWSRRHPSVVIASLVVVFVIMVGLLLSNWMLERRTLEAEKRYRQARHAVDMLIQVSEDELSDKPDLNGLRRKLLEAALVAYEDFTEQHRDDKELAGVQARLRRILEELSVLDGAFRAQLLKDPAVRDDLKLTAQQRDQVEELTQHWSDPFFGPAQRLRDLSPEQRHQRFLEMARDRDRRLKVILTPAQLGRLKQLDIQFQGFHAFHNSEIQEALHLTAGQKTLIKDIENEFFGPPPGGPGHGPPDGRGPGPRDHHHGHQFADGRKSALERAVAVLTPEQRLIWSDLVGEPCPGLTRFHPPHFGPPPDIEP